MHLQRMLTIVCACVALMTARAALAQGRSEPASVNFNWSERETVVGGHIELDIEVVNGSQISEPALPPLDGFVVRRTGGPFTSNQTSIINGRVDHRVTTTYQYDVSPTKAGKLAVPSIAIEVDGKTFKSEPTLIVAREAHAADSGDELIVDVVADPRTPLVGQPTTMTLRIWVRPYRQPEKNIKLDDAQMWSQIDLEHSKLGIFKKQLDDWARRARRPAGQRELRDDREYYVYSIATSYRATHAGPPDLGEISIALEMPTSVRAGRNFFGQSIPQVYGSRTVTASPSLVDADIRPLPEEGKPEFFNGAVGRFTVSATAKPTQVSVGDPITVTYTVMAQSNEDSAALEELQAPPFAAMPELTKSFRIPSDPIAGRVSDRRKVFTQTFRPITADVKEIPAIPFAYFDPSRGEYSVAQTAAIPVTVAASERLNMSQIVGGDANPVDRPQQRLTTVAGGLLANVPPSTALLANQRATVGATMALIAGAPPIACAALALFVAARRRREADPLRRRSARAARTALSALAAKTTPESTLTALAGYVADRCALPEGARTRGDAVAELREQGVSDEIVARFDRLLSLCERARYAPRGADDVSVNEARELVRELERVALRAKVGAR